MQERHSNIDVLKAIPNIAHIALAKAEQKYDVQIITTNVDDLLTA